MKKIYIIFIALCLCGELLQAQTRSDLVEQDYYQISTLPIPEDVVLEVGGLAFNDQGQLAVSTRRGEVWVIDQPGSQTPTFQRFAQGMHEALGLAYKDGDYYLSQRGELTRLRDENNDGKADLYEPVTVWPLAGNYHEYSYGPKFLPDGNMIVTLNLAWIGHGASLSLWRGWMLKITPQGKTIPLATGMRSPAGFGINAAGDIFYTENQGDWVGSGRMTHIESGDFVGHPAGLKWTYREESPLALKVDDIKDKSGYSLYQYKELHPEVKPPSVWFPHGLMGISTSDVLLIDGEQDFGPFTGQLLVGDQGHSKIMRVYQEKIEGVYQGACFPFKEGFASGILRMVWGPDRNLYVGMTSRGWAATGPEPYAVERLEWTGKTPFEMQRINIQEDGFTIHFTEPVDPATAEDPAAYQLTDFTYNYHKAYGSKVIDSEVKKVSSVKVAADGKSARLVVEGMRLGYIYEIKAAGVKNKTGQSLVHPDAYYTVNRIPGGGGTQVSSAAAAAETQVKTLSRKNITLAPKAWTGKPMTELEVGTLPGLKYDTEELSVKSGARVKMTFNNKDDMLHNLLIVAPGKASEVGDMALKLGLAGQEQGYVPETDLVLFHSGLLQPHSSVSFYFEAPSKPGRYEYVCTFPGHAMSMRGVLVVE